MATNAIVNDLQFFGGRNRQTGHVFDSPRNGIYILMLSVAQPTRFTNAIGSHFKLARLMILNSSPFKLEMRLYEHFDKKKTELPEKSHNLTRGLAIFLTTSISVSKIMS